MLRPLYRMGIRERFETTDDEARAIAWRQWYGPEPTTEFEELLREAF